MITLMDDRSYLKNYLPSIQHKLKGGGDARAMQGQPGWTVKLIKVEGFGIEGWEVGRGEPEVRVWCLESNVLLGWWEKGPRSMAHSARARNTDTKSGVCAESRLRQAWRPVSVPSHRTGISSGYLNGKSLNFGLLIDLSKDRSPSVPRDLFTRLDILFEFLHHAGTVWVEFLLAIDKPGFIRFPLVTDIWFIPQTYIATIKPPLTGFSAVA